MMLNKILGICLLLIFLGSSLGCTSIKTNSNYDTTFDFSQLKTYAWGENSISSVKLQGREESVLSGVEQMARRDIQPIVDSLLKDKGFALNSSGNSDFIIVYKATGTLTQDIPQVYYPGTPSYITYSTQIGAFMMGAIQIEITNPKTKDIIWRGYGETPISGDGSSNAKLTRALKKILKDFPPR